MATSVSASIARYLLVPIVAVWVYHLVQRRYTQQGARKRDATLYVTLVLLCAWVLVYLVARFSREDLYLVPIAFLAVIVLVWQRRAIFPYRMRCARCGLPLSIARILFYDSNTCETCEPRLEKGENQR